MLQIFSLTHLLFILLDSINCNDSTTFLFQTLQAGGTVGAEPWRPLCLGREQQRVALVGL